MRSTTNTARYRKYNDGSHNSSKYHKLDGTPVRGILKEETRKEIAESYPIPTDQPAGAEHEPISSKPI